MSLLNLYKCSSSFGIILMFLICILLTTMTIYGWTNQDIFWSDQKTKDLILGLMATVSFLLLMVSIIAIAKLIIPFIMNCPIAPTAGNINPAITKFIMASLKK